MDWKRAVQPSAGEQFYSSISSRGYRLNSERITHEPTKLTLCCMSAPSCLTTSSSRTFTLVAGEKVHRHFPSPFVQPSPKFSSVPARLIVHAANLHSLDCLIGMQQKSHVPHALARQGLPTCPFRRDATPVTPPRDFATQRRHRSIAFWDNAARAAYLLDV